MFYVEGKRVMNSARGGEALCGCGGAHRVGYRRLKGDPSEIVLQLYGVPNYVRQDVRVMEF